MADTEKITINLGAVDLGKIDLLVEQGHYSNRTDFIRTAIRSQLEKHTLEVQQSVARHAYGVGVFSYDKAELERYKAKGEKVKFNILGYLSIASDVSSSLASEVIESVQVRGIFQAPDQVKAALADRIK